MGEGAGRAVMAHQSSTPHVNKKRLGSSTLGQLNFLLLDSPQFGISFPLKKKQGIPELTPLLPGVYDAARSYELR